MRWPSTNTSAHGVTTTRKKPMRAGHELERRAAGGDLFLLAASRELDRAAADRDDESEHREAENGRSNRRASLFEDGGDRLIERVFDELRFDERARDQGFPRPANARAHEIVESVRDGQRARVAIAGQLREQRMMTRSSARGTSGARTRRGVGGSRRMRCAAARLTCRPCRTAARRNSIW